MMTSEEAIKKLKEYWGTNILVFQAEFHVPKNVSLREGTKPFGYFRNIRFNGELLEYPSDTLPTHERRVSIYQVLKPDLKDQEQYEVTLDLAKDEYRKKNPFQLIVKNYKKLPNESKIIDTTLHRTIKDIFNENININSPFQVVNLANSVESLATDIYSEDKRFIYELIQNADDAAFDEDSELSIQVLSNYVIISHNGSPFNSRDIRGLCSIGIGTKTNDATKTGYKGIGFKSVFGQPDGLVYVKSENTLFKFDREYSRKKGWNIKWGNKEEWEERNGVTFNCPWQMMPVLIENLDDAQLEKVLANEKYTVKTAIKIVDSEQVFKNINKFFGDAKFLLFLRRLTRVEIIFDKNTISFNKEKKQDNKEIVSLIKNNELLSNWYVKNWIHNIPIEIQKELKSDPKTPKKIQSMEKTEISFALEINDTLNEIKLLDEGKSLLYSYLPTEETQYNIPFIVNCNFLLDASREKIHKNRKWNEWLFQVIGYKTVECCYEFLINSLFETTYLSIFRNGFIPESDNLRAKINAGLKIGLEKFAILKNRNNELCKLDEVALDRFNLFQVEPELVNKLAAFINEKEEKVLLDAKNIIELSDLISHILKLKPFVISESILQDFFSSAYIEQVITLKSNYKILSFLCPLETKDPSGTWYTVVTKYQLIINQDEQLDYIKRVCFPMELGESSYDTEFKNALIHNDVYQLIKDDVELIAWLIKLGVSEPGSIAYLEKEIIGNIQNVIKNTNYLTITKFIYRLYTDKRLTEAHYVNLQELPLKTDKGFKKANLCVLPKSYNPTIDFSSKLPAQAYLSDEYLEIANARECKSFFKILAVRDDIEFTNKLKINSPDLPPSFVEVSNKFAREGHTYPHLIGVFHPNIPISNVPYYLQSFTFLDQIIKFEFAIVFWNRIFDKYSFTKNRDAKSPLNYAPQKDYTVYNLGGGCEFSTFDEMAWGRQPNNTTYIPSYFIWYIQNTKCIPTNMGLKLAFETYTNTDKISELAGDFLPIIKIDKVVPEDWNKVLKMKTILSIEDLFTILDGISDLASTKGNLDKENEKRLGLIYNELILKLNNDNSVVYHKIKNWAIGCNLVSTSKKRIKASKLLYINIAGFENTNTNLDIIFLPKNVETNNAHFIDFLTVLGIKIIDEFNYQADIVHEIFDLKIKLLNLVGPVCLLLKNKMIVSDIDKAMYERFIKISKTQFYLCSNMYPIFTTENEVIRGELVNFYHDKVENKFLISIDWQNPLTILEISYEISSLLSAVRLEKEIMMLLSLSISQIEQYIIIQKLDLKEYRNSEVYKEIINEVEKLQELISTNRIKQIATVNEASSKNVKIDDYNLDGEDNSDNGLNQDTDLIRYKDETEYDFIKEVENFINAELENTEWAEHIPELNNILELSKRHPKEKQKLYNLIAKLKLAKATIIHFDVADSNFNQLINGNEKYFVHSARGSFAYIHTNEILRMRDEGFNMALDFGSKTPIKIYQTAQEILSLNTSHLLAYQNEKTMEDLFNFCEHNRDANKHLLVIDKVNSKQKSNDIFKLLNPEDDYQ